MTDQDVTGIIIIYGYKICILGYYLLQFCNNNKVLLAVTKINVAVIIKKNYF